MIVKRALLFLLIASVATNAAAQGEVTRIIVPFSAGGPVDSVARAMSEQLGKELGSTIVIENKPGGNGVIGAMTVIRAKPDGKTIWLTSVGAAAINGSLYKDIAYDMQRDFAPVSLVVNNVEVLVTKPENPARDAAEFVANAKMKSTPTSMASSGVGSIPHLAIEQLTDSTGAKFLHVPYKGAAPAINDVMGGQVEGFFGDIPGLIGQVKGGKLKALGIASSKRSAALPDVKTLEEQGIKGVDTINWYAMFVSAKTPPAIIAALNKAVRNTLNTPAVRDRLLQFGADPAPSSSEELANSVKSDTAKWAKLIHAKNIKAE